MRALIIGYGTVGHNLARELGALDRGTYDACLGVYDKYEGIRDFGGRYDVAFVCVDTPLVDGALDTTEVEAAIRENEADVFVVKSTVPVGTTRRLAEETGKRVVFSPEYYGSTQHANNYDFDFTILGGATEDCVPVIQLLQEVYDGRHRFRMTTPEAAELAKLTENAWIATKVSFCNQMAEIAETEGVPYEELRELFLLDERVSPAHTYVYRAHPWWDSHCLNKDVPALANAYDAPLLRAVVEYNES